MKNIKRYFTKRNLLFIAIFAFVGFIALQIPVTQVWGSKAKFTVYDAFAPIAGAFIGSIPGVIAVFLMQFFNFLIHGAHIQDAGTIIRFFPTLFAALYFAKKGKFNLIIPIIAIAAFVVNPIGRTVWYFSLFWLIPIIAYFFAIVSYSREHLAQHLPLMQLAALCGFGHFGFPRLSGIRLFPW